MSPLGIRGDELLRQDAVDGDCMYDLHVPASFHSKFKKSYELQQFQTAKKSVKGFEICDDISSSDIRSKTTQLAAKKKIKWRSSPEEWGNSIKMENRNQNLSSRR